MRKFTITILAVIMILFQWTASATAVPADGKGNAPANGFLLSRENLDSDLDAFIEERKSGTAGVSFAVFDDGQLIIRKDYGHTDVENGILVDEDSVFEWGSVSKLLVWISAMQLYEEGKLDLNEDIENYLPEEFLKNKEFENKISFIDLMNHQAGFQETIYPVETTDPEVIQNNSLSKALISAMPPQIYEPGTVTAYSNWGTVLGAFVVENITGQEFAGYVHKNIFDRLGMKRTALLPDWSDNPWVKEKRAQMHSYSYFDTEKEDFGPNISNVLLYPAGAAAGTATDFYLFTEALIPGNSSRLFKDPGTLEALYEPTLYFSNSDKVRNAHGLWTLEYGNTVYGHAGNTIGFTSSLWIDKENRTAVAVMSNEQGEMAYNYGLHPLIFGQANLLAGGKAKDISGMYFPKRTYEKGFARIYKYISGLMPVSGTEDSRKFSLPGGAEIIQIDDHTYMQDSKNGLLFPVRLGEEGKLESFTSDYERFSFLELIFAWFLIIGTIVSLAAFLIRSVFLIIKRIRRKPSDLKKLLLSAGISLFSLALIVLWFNSGITRSVAVIQSAMIMVLGITPILQMIYSFKSDLKRSKARWFWAGLALTPLIAMVFMQSYSV